MSQPRAKTFTYAVDFEEDGRFTAHEGGSLVLPDGWNADHMLLGAVLRCSIESLAFHVRRAGSTLHAHGSASGSITKRESDGRYAFVAIELTIVTRFDPPLDATEELFEKAQRDCFVGASLTVKPSYTWRLA